MLPVDCTPFDLNLQQLLYFDLVLQCLILELLSESFQHFCIPALSALSLYVHVVTATKGYHSCLFGLSIKCYAMTSHNAK